MTVTGVLRASNVWKIISKHYKRKIGSPSANCCVNVQLANVCLMADGENPAKHQCNKAYCERCKTEVDKNGHQCFMRRLPDPNQKKDGKASKKTNKKNTKTRNQETKEPPKQKFIFFDFECRQDEEVDTNVHGSVFKHIPNLCVAFQVCEDCHSNKENACTNCGV